MIDRKIFCRTAVLSLLLFAGLMTGYPQHARKTFMVEKIGTGKHYFYHEGDYIKLRVQKPDSLMEGRLWSIGDSSVVITGLHPFEVGLGNINSVYKRFAFPTKCTKAFAVAGVVFFSIIGINHLINNEQVFTSDIFIVSGAMFGISAISWALSEKRCRAAKGWKFKILELKQ